MQRHQAVTGLLLAMVILSVAFVLKVMASERRAQRAALEAERASAMVSDEHDESAKLIGVLLGDLTGKVSPEVYQASKALVFRSLEDAESGGSDAASVHARSVALDTKGFVQQRAGDLAGALDFYRRALRLREETSKAGRTDLALHDLSVSYHNIGDLQAATSQFDLALSGYLSALALSRELLTRDPENARWINDLAVSNGKAAAIYFDQNNYAEAATYYQEGLKLADTLVARDAAFAKWKALRAFFLGGIGRTALRTGDFAAARRSLTEARESLLALQRDRKLTDEQSGWLRDFAEDLAALPPPAAR
jgi:tetratricopeptide (TPR) repeat protein